MAGLGVFLWIAELFRHFLILCLLFMSFILMDCSISGCEVYNLGTGKGTSVLEMVAAFEKASGKV